MAKFPDRLEYKDDGNGKKTLIDNTHNKNILKKKPLKTKYNPEGKTASEFTNEEIIEKFLNYEELFSFDYKHIDPSTEKRWYRVLLLVDDEYKYRAGGFIIFNDPDERYFIFKNPALNFTFSIPYNIRLFRSRSKNVNLYPPKCRSFIDKYFSKRDKFVNNRYIGFSVRIKKGALFIDNSVRGLFDQLPNDDFKPRSTSTISGTISRKAFKTKGYYFNRVNKDTIDQIKSDFGEIDDCNNIFHDVMRKRLKNILERGNVV